MDNEQIQQRTLKAVIAMVQRTVGQDISSEDRARILATELNSQGLDVQGVGNDSGGVFAQIKGNDGIFQIHEIVLNLGEDE